MVVGMMCLSTVMVVVTRFQGTDSVHEIKSILFSKVNVRHFEIGMQLNHKPTSSEI